jgi:hypothetical protein
MKKIALILVISTILLAGCSSFGSLNNQTVSDEQMATRVAQLLATMTTPTQEIEFPATPTPMATTVFITATPLPVTLTPVVTETQGFTATPGTETATPLVTPTLTPTQITGTLTITPTGTATAPATDPILSLGIPTSTDTFDSASNWTWPTGSDDYINVVFNNGYMQMTGLTKLAGWRLPLVDQQVNSYIELTANSGTCTGKDSYGIIFRVPVFKDPTQGYLYEVTCDGYYRLWKWDGEASSTGLATTLVGWKQSSAINAGANQSNRLGVMVKGSTYTLYMNGVQLGSASDSGFAAGFLGVFVRSAETTDYTVNFDTMKLWENP